MTMNTKVHSLAATLTTLALLAAGCAQSFMPEEGGVPLPDGEASLADGGAPPPDTTVGTDAKLWTCSQPGRSCNAHNTCAIDPVCGEDRLCRPKNYQSCDDKLSCTVDTCKGMGLCDNTPKPGYCRLAVKSGANTVLRCFKKGAPNPAAPCKICDPTRSAVLWSPRSGGSCDDGNACTRNDYCSNGTCKGTYYGDLCSDGFSCTTDQCDGKGGCLGSKLKVGHCLINGACYKDKAKNPTSGCYHCDVNKTVKAWTSRPNSCLASPFVMDGKLDAGATKVAGGKGTMPLYLALKSDHLYMATHDAGEGNDNFIIFSVHPPTTFRKAPWGKAGSIMFHNKSMFLADENDNGYCGFFELGPASYGVDKVLATCDKSKVANHYAIGTQAKNGGWLEGTVNFKEILGSLPKHVYIAAAAYGTNNYGKLTHSAQTPATKNKNGNIDSSEILKVALPSLKVVP